MSIAAAPIPSSVLFCSPAVPPPPVAGAPAGILERVLCAPRPGAADFAGSADRVGPAEGWCVGDWGAVGVSLGDAAGEDLPVWPAAGADLLV